MSRIFTYATAAALAIAGLALPAVAQEFPTQSIRIAVGFGPGSVADVLARLTGKHLEAKLGRPVIVENRPGNSSMIAAEQVAKAAKDGHTLFMGTVAQTLVPVRKKMDFKLDRDMTPVSLLAIVPNLLVAHPSLGVKDVPGLIGIAKSKPDSLTFGTSGAGTASHLAAELFNQRVGAKIVVVHYQAGSNQALVDLLAGRINLIFNTASTLVPHVENKALVALGVAQAARTKVLPQVPTMAEQGLAGFDAGIWIGLLAPAGTPPKIAEVLASASTEALGTEAVAKVLSAQGIDALGGTPAEFARFIAQDIEKWSKVVSGAGLYE
ncbi:unnamed protein product [Phaeothamnion confervicola]